MRQYAMRQLSSQKHKFGQLSGFVNGVLRNIARNINDIKYPDVKKNLTNI